MLVFILIKILDNLDKKFLFIRFLEKKINDNTFHVLVPWSRHVTLGYESYTKHTPLSLYMYI